MTRLYYEAPAGVQGLRPVLGALASPDVDVDHLDAALRAPLVVTDETVYARNVNGWPHRITDPREVLEALWSRDLWPWSPGDIDAPRWWCSNCGGTGGVSWRGEYGVESDWCGLCGRDDPGATGGVTADGTTEDPPSLAELIAVASLGVARLRQVNDCVAALHTVTRRRCEACDGYGTTRTVDVTTGDASEQTCGACNGERAVAGVGRQIVWRVMTAEALEKWHGEVEERRLAHPFTTIFSRESNTESKYRERWPAECPYRGWFGYPDNDSRGTHRSWPTLRSLALDCGVHLIDVTPARCVIGVPYHPQ